SQGVNVSTYAVAPVPRGNAGSTGRAVPPASRGGRPCTHHVTTGSPSISGSRSADSGPTLAVAGSTRSRFGTTTITASPAMVPLTPARTARPITRTRARAARFHANAHTKVIPTVTAAAAPIPVANASRVVKPSGPPRPLQCVASSAGNRSRCARTQATAITAGATATATAAISLITRCIAARLVLCPAAAELFVHAQEPGAVVTDEPQPAQDFRDGGFLLDLLLEEPAEQRQAVDVVLGQRQPVERADRLRHLL